MFGERMAVSIAVSLLLAREASRDSRFLETIGKDFDEVLGRLSMTDLDQEIRDETGTYAREHFQRLLSFARTLP